MKFLQMIILILFYILTQKELTYSIMYCKTFFRIFLGKNLLEFIKQILRTSSYIFC